MQRFLGVVLVGILLLFPGQSLAQEPVRIDVNVKEYRLAPHAEYWFESEEFLSLEEVRSEPIQSQFKPINAPFSNFGTITNRVWYRFTLSNSSPQEQERVLLTSWFSQNKVAYAIDRDSGAITPLLENPQNYWFTRYALTLPPKSETEIYLAFGYDMADGHIAHLKMTTPNGYWQWESAYFSLSSVYYGAIAIMALYNLFLFYTIRDRAYLFYVLTILTYFFYIGAMDGIGINFLWGPYANTAVGFLGGYCFVFFAALFAMKLLDTKDHHPRCNRFLEGYALLVFVIFVLLIAFPINLITTIALVVGSAGPWILFGAGILSLKKKPRVAKLYLAGWSLFLFFLTNNSLILLGYPILDITMMDSVILMKVSSLVELTLFSIALSDRIHDLTEEALHAQEELAKSAQRHSQELENRVADRTLELKEANQAKDRFFSILAHDLRGPIGNIAMLFDMARNHQVEINEDLINGLADNTKNIQQLLEDLLLWSQDQSGQLQVHTEHFDVQEIIEQSLGILQGVAHLKDIHLDFHREGSRYVLADRSMIFTVVRNLIGNAIKFTAPGGSIQILTKIVEHHLRLSVKDSGVGMTEERLRRLFDLNSTHRTSLGTENEKGHGLGLVLCKDFVEKNKGEIGARSKPGAGSEFWFTLPLGEESASKPKRHPLLSEFFLLVEDDPIMAKTAGFILKELGVSFHHATDGVAAFEWLRQNKAGIVLMDIDMPRLNGVEASWEIQKIAKPKLIALSSYSEAEVKERYGEAQFEAYLQKPLIPERLLKALEQIEPL